MVTAVILSYNRCADLLYTVKKLKKIQLSVSFRLDIIVVDNGSADQTSANMIQEYPDVTLITKTKNNGIAGWNDGFKIVDTKYILVLDDDSHLEDGLPEAIDFFETNPDVGVLALSVTGGRYETKNWIPYDETIGFIGCGAIIKKEVYDRIGGFAEWIYTNAHEWEYALRCKDAGYRTIFFNKAHVIHRSANGLCSKRAITYSTRNEMAIVYKYYGTHKWLYISRVFINNAKVIKAQGIVAGFYSMLGAIKFLKLCIILKPAPVSDKNQAFFNARFWATQPVFNSLNWKKRK
jgi:GT2 family glycosyltransferase